MIAAIRHHVRYSMHWGHKINTAEGPKAITRAEYNRAFGVAVPPKPEIDECIRYPWTMWARLNNRRPPSEYITPLSFSEIDAFRRITNESLTPEEVQMIVAVDDAYVRAIAEERDAMRERERESKAAPKRK